MAREYGSEIGYAFKQNRNQAAATDLTTAEERRRSFQRYNPSTFTGCRIDADPSIALRVNGAGAVLTNCRRG